MAPVPTPVLKDADAEKQMYRGLALTQLAILRRTMALGGLNTGSRVIELVNGVVITCRKIFNQEEIFIDLADAPFAEEIKTTRFYPHGFLTHPRSGDVKGYPFRLLDSANTLIGGTAHYGTGWRVESGKLVDIDGQGVYPLVDADKGTTLFSKNMGGDWKSIPYKNSDDDWLKTGTRDILYGELTEPANTWLMPADLNYGNVDWKGPVADQPKARKILTYRGNPSRYWPINQFADIPGLTKIDHTIESVTGDYSYTTPFSEFVYSMGLAIAEMPALYAPTNSEIQKAQVLGAAIQTADGVMVCVIKTCYNTYPREKAVGEMVSTWQVWDGDVLIKDWLGDRAGADLQVASAVGYKIVEVPDPGRGYFIELIVRAPGDIEGGWKRLLRHAVQQGMPNCNFFFSEDGSKACSVMFDRLYVIEVVDGVASITESSLGGFRYQVSSSENTTTVSNPGDPDPTQSGIFAQIYRTGVSVGDWINKSETIKSFSGSKSGTLTLAADYKGNTLVKMDAILSGSDSYTHRRVLGFKWGETALPQSQHVGMDGDFNRTPSIRISFDPVSPFDGSFTGYIGVSIFGACEPTIIIDGTSYTGGDIKRDGGIVVPYTPPPCNMDPTAEATISITVTVTDDVTDRTATQTKVYRDPRGHWVRTFDYSCDTNSTGCQPFNFASGLCAWSYNCQSCDPCTISGSCSGSYINPTSAWEELSLTVREMKSGFYSNGGYGSSSGCCLGSPASVAGAVSFVCTGANGSPVYYTGPSTVISRHIIEEWRC